MNGTVGVGVVVDTVVVVAGVVVVDVILVGQKQGEGVTSHLNVLGLNVSSPSHGQCKHCSPAQ